LFLLACKISEGGWRENGSRAKNESLSDIDRFCLRWLIVCGYNFRRTWKKTSDYLNG